MRLAAGVKLGGVTELAGVVVGVDSVVGDEVTVLVAGVEDGELVGLALPDNVADDEIVAVAVAVGLVASDDVGVGLSKVSDGAGVELSPGVEVRS